MSDMEEVEETPDEKNYVPNAPTQAVQSVVKEAHMKHKWKTPDVEDIQPKSQMKHVSAPECFHAFHNKFVANPNKYVFNKHDRYNKNIYKGYSDNFWKGFYAHDQGKFVIDFVELGIQNRITKGDIYDRAFVD